jgi:hypothetical protein
VYHPELAGTTTSRCQGPTIPIYSVRSAHSKPAGGRINESIRLTENRPTWNDAASSAMPTNHSVGRIIVIAPCLLPLTLPRRLARRQHSRRRASHGANTRSGRRGGIVVYDTQLLMPGPDKHGDDVTPTC